MRHIRQMITKRDNTLNLCFLGTASGIPEDNRFGQTLVATVDQGHAGVGHYLLDVGDGASSLLIRAGYDHRDIRAIMISHMHGDHHAGFIHVIKTSMHLERREELLVFAPEEGIAPLQAYLRASYLQDEMLGFPIRWVSLADVAKSPFELPGGCVFHAYSNSHLDSARIRFGELGVTDHGRSFESYSMALEDSALRVVYSGNLLGPRGADELEPFLEPCDVLVCELSHVEPGELGRVLRGRDIRKIVLAHFHPTWHDVSEAEILQRIQQGAGGPDHLGEIIFTQDGDCIDCMPAPESYQTTWG